MNRYRCKAASSALLLFLVMAAFALSAFTTAATAGQQHEGSHQHAGHEEQDATMEQAISINNAAVISSRYAADGTLWAAWAQGKHVYVNYSRDDGKTFSNPIKVNAIPEDLMARHESRPKLALGPEGNLYIAYTQKLAKKYTGNIRFSRSTDGGKTFSAPITVNSDTRIISHRFESMAVNRKGDIFIAWLDARDAADAKAKGENYVGSALYYAVSRDRGESFPVNTKIQDNTCQCCRTAMAIDGEDNPVIHWRHVFLGEKGAQIRDHALVRLSASPDGKGMDIHTPQRVAEDGWVMNACPHHGPALTIAEDDVYHLAWFTGAPGKEGLHYAHSMDQGQSFSAALHFGSGEQQAQHPDIFASSKQVYLVWKTFDGSQSTLMLMTSNDKGNTWGKPRAIAQAKGHSDYPFFLPRPDSAGGQVKVAWLNKQHGFQVIDVMSK